MPIPPDAGCGRGLICYCVGMTIRIALLSVLAGVSLMAGGCAAVKDSHAGESAVSGSVGVRVQSRDTSRFAPEHAPF
ncbi:MAG: hypothetical protein ABIP20_10730 [Chthoniobacteraceae bacterium]